MFIIETHNHKEQDLQNNTYWNVQIKLMTNIPVSFVRDEKINLTY